MIYTTEYLAVIVTAIGSFVIGFLWYGPLFGKIWVKLMHFSGEQMEEAKKQGMAKPLTLSMLSNLITAFVFFTLGESLGIAGFGGAFILALGIWIAFCVPIYLYDVLWEGKSWNLFWLGSLHIFATLVWAGIVYTLWM